MKPIRIATIVAFLICSTPVLAQTVTPGYEVGTWQGFRAAAVTHTFDDNTPNQLAVAVPMFNEFGFNLTLYTVTNWGPNWSGLAAAVAEGHEVTSHTVTHRPLNTLSNEQQTTELVNSRDAILANVSGAEVLTLAYPNCVRGSDAITSQYYIAARGCSGRIETSTPSDMLNISSIIVGSQGPVKTTADFNDRAEAAARSGGWVVFLAHAIDNDNGYSPVPSDEIRGHLEYLSANTDRFWVDTFANVVRYIHERDAASVTEVSVEQEEVVVQVTDTLDDAIYNVSISIRRALPEGWESATVTQNGEPAHAEVIEVDGELLLMFDVVPDGGEVVLARSDATGTSPEDGGGGDQTFIIGHYPNPFHSTTTLVYQVGQTDWVTLEVYDMLGRKLETLVDRFQQTGRHAVDWNASGYSPGSYAYRLRVGEYVETGVMVIAR